jgi:multidrug efflux pump subunit AcrA (membrane-fusion protein)
MKRSADLPRSVPFPTLIMVVAVGLIASCVTNAPPKPARPAPVPEPTAEIDPCAELLTQQKTLEENVANLDGEKRALEAQVTGLKLQLLEEQAGARELEERQRQLEAKLDEAIQEVVRAKSKLRSVETRAEAASNLAEAEIALKAIEAQAKGDGANRGLPQARQLLKRSAEEFKKENYGGALYLADQAKGLLRSGETRAANRERLAVVEGESPFEAPMPLRLTKDGNLREGPGLEFKVLATLPSGTRLVGLSRKDQWVRVRDEKGVAGWVFKALVAAP